jgi:hypothetical protein
VTCETCGQAIAITAAGRVDEEVAWLGLPRKEAVDLAMAIRTEITMLKGPGDTEITGLQ